MTNLTISVDEGTLRRARTRALQQGTSVNAVLQAQLRAYAGDDDVDPALRELIEQARRSKSGERGRGRSWTRGELHER